ncbi:MAG: ABC transporter substrate-binding protein [Oscillospiraceae bacterium]|nr:ABC transporter substrate-binding protein [Oscillospiraceae bacterium]
MKKYLALVLAVLMVFSLCACGGDNGGSGDEKVIKIGVYEPQTGANGAGGKQEILGMQYANYKCPTVEVGGETYKVELVYADNESANEKAVSAATELIAEGVSVVLGSYGSGVSIAASDTFKEAGVPAIGVTCTNPQVTEGNEHYFRICFLDPFQGTVHANFAKDELQATKVYCLGELGNDYDQGLINYFKEAAEKLDIEVTTESFPKDNSDFTSYLNNAKKAGAQAIFAPVSIQYAQLIVEQADAQGVDIPLLGSDTWDNNTIVGATVGKNTELYVSTFYAEGGNPDFEKGIKEWINADPKNVENNGGNDMLSAVTVMGYDAYMVALEAIKAAGSVEAADVMAALPGVTYTGISGDISFNDTGDANRDAAYIKTANTETGVWDFVAVQKAG